MSFPKPPVVASSVALLAALSLIPSQGQARDNRPVGEDVILEIPALSADGVSDVIFELAPMKPVKGAVAQARKALTPAADKPASPAVAAKPADSKAAASEPIPAGQPVAAAAPATPPLMISNPPFSEIADLNAPAESFHSHGTALADSSAAPTLVPALEPLAETAEPAPRVAIAEQPAEEETAENAQPEPAGVAPADPEMAQAVAAGEPAASEAEADARISELLGQGLVGPIEVRLADRATMWLPAGRVFIPLEAARKLAEEVGLAWRAGGQGMVAPSGGKLEWLASIELLDDGYIKTDVPAAFDPAKLFAAFEASLPAVNAQRAGAGQSPVTLSGWLAPPALNAKHRLSACVNILARNDLNESDRFFNCEAWALGRDGALKIGLADSEENAARLKDETAALAGTIVFDHAKAYEDFDPATDRVAPYAAADLLTRDVGAQATPPVPSAPPAVATGEGAVPASSRFDSISELVYPALFGIAALGLYLRMRRKGAAAKEAEATETAPITMGAVATPDAKQSNENVAIVESPALFARLLPTIHARFAKKAAPNAAPLKESPARPGAPEAESRKEPLEMSVGGFVAKLTALRSATRKVKTEASLKQAPAVKPANDIEEPASALKKLAAKMRRKDDEPPPVSVNVSRAIRPTRGAAGAALAEKLVEPSFAQQESSEPSEAKLELIEPQFPAPEPMESTDALPGETAPSTEFEQAEVFAPSSPTGAASRAHDAFDDDDLGLVEPGDVEAASAAISAARARHEARE